MWLVNKTKKEGKKERKKKERNFLLIKRTIPCATLFVFYLIFYTNKLYKLKFLLFESVKLINYIRSNV